MAGRIIVLALSERVTLTGRLASFDLEVEYLDKVMEVFRSCVRRPPGALIVDMVSASALEFGSREPDQSESWLADSSLSCKTRRHFDVGIDITD